MQPCGLQTQRKRYTCFETAGGSGWWWRLQAGSGGSCGQVFAGKENSFSLGEYQAVKVGAARAETLKIKGRMATGIDPGVFRKMEKEKRSGENSFTMVAREWIALKSPGWSLTHSNKMTSVLENDVFPYIGTRDIGEITAPEILAVPKRVDTRPESS